MEIFHTTEMIYINFVYISAKENCDAYLSSDNLKRYLDFIHLRILCCNVRNHTLIDNGKQALRALAITIIIAEEY